MLVLMSIIAHSLCKFLNKNPSKFMYDTLSPRPNRLLKDNLLSNFEYLLQDVSAVNENEEKLMKKLLVKIKKFSNKLQTKKLKKRKINYYKFAIQNNHQKKKQSRIDSYKQSNKIEKLLNDSRGMKKYLINYDDLLGGQIISESQLEFSFSDISNSTLICNQDDSLKESFSSSGYLSDF